MEKIQKPKIEKGTMEGQGKAAERVAEFSYETLEKEAAIKMPLHRKAGYMLTTFLAMGLALSFPGKAEAQFRIGGKDLGSRITRDVLTAGKNAWEMRQNEKIIQVHTEYQEKLGKLMEAEGQVDEEYYQYKLKLRESGDEEALRQLEEDYRREKIKMKEARIKLERERDTKLAKIKIMKGVVGSGISSAR